MRPHLPRSASSDPVLLVGLTGNIASGKSEVARRLAQLGAAIIDADDLAREAVRPGTAALDAIAGRWGPRVLLPDGSLDRAALRDIVFRDETERQALNAIVHPAVRRLRDARVAEARSRGTAIVVADVPLLFEAGLDREVDVIVLVDAPETVRLQRLVDHRGLGEDEARRMIASQWPSAPKRARADFVVDNDASLADLDGRVRTLWAALCRRAAPGGAGP